MREQNEEENEYQTTSIPIPPKCDRLHKSLAGCLRHAGPAQCRHLNRALAECVLASICPEEAEAVRSLCGSSGTELKRAQCENAQIGLSACLSAHQK